MTTARDAVREAALDYARLGWCPIPVYAPIGSACSCWKTECKSPGKHPIGKGWVEKATADLDKVASWFGEFRKRVNVGIVLGGSGLVVVDIDTHGGDGYATIAELEAKLGALPPTVTADTGGGGEHRLFRAPSDQPKVAIGKAVQLLRGGEQILVEPSLHHSGRTYRWRDGFRPGEIDLAELPAAWIEFARATPTPTRTPRTPRTPRDPRKTPTKSNGDDFYAALESLDQGDVLDAISGSWLVKGETIERIPTSGGRYDLRIDGQVTRGFIDVGGMIGHENTGTARAGKDGGPLVSTWLRHYGHDNPTIRRGLTELVPALACFAKVYRLTELGNAERLAAMHGDRLRYVQAWGKWLAWDGRRWCRDQAGSEIVAGKSVVRSIYAEQAAAAARAAAGDEQAASIASTLAAWAKSSAKRAAIQSMATLAQTEDPIAATPDMFDADPFVFNVANGTINLRTGELHAHRPTDAITMLAPVTYDPAAPAPRWEAFLARVLPDAEVRTWIQRYLGYCLTGDVGEQVLAFAYGGGQNGKSVLFDAALMLLGDYGLRAAPELVLAKYGEAHPTELADLDGRRLVVCSEIEQGRQWAESTIKRITGDTTITARRMRQDFYTFTATHKIVVAANTKPMVRGTDHAIWRRMRLVPFEVTIPEAERTKNLADILVEQEGTGILAWLVRGCLDWQQHGLGEPAAITGATAGYRVDQDVLGHWIEDRCVLIDAAWTATAALYASYSRWCGESGHEPWTRDTMRARLLERAGITEARRNHGRDRGLAGIGLRTERTGMEVVR